MSPPLMEIRRRIAGSQHHVLDRKVLVQTRTREAADVALLWEMVTVHGGAWTVGYFDVPIEAVVAVGRASSVMEMGDTWRDIVNFRLHGEDWWPEALTYPDSEIRDRPFPASRASGLLKLNTVAGAIACSNGNHRLAAAVAWIAATRPEAPFLWKATLHVAPVHQQLIDWLLSQYAAGARLHYLYLSTSLVDNWMVRVEHWGHVAEYRVHQGSIERVRFRPKFPGKLAEVKEHQQHGPWMPVPAAVLGAWANADWLRSQLAGGIWEPLRQ